MKCPKCQHENPEEAIFCMKCGQKFGPSPEPSLQTQSFDEKIDKIQRYLPKGLTEKILAQRGKIEGERKQITVMFCDMEGFTPLVEKLGPEKAYSIMDEIYEILIHKVHEFEGTVNEMTGDGIMALFGAPIALEDAPQRALRSALAIHQEIANFNGNRKGMDPIKMRIGVHTGPVVVGTLGNDLRVEFKAVGDTVNLASRMEGLAEPGTTYLTEDTFKLTDQLFNFEALGERAVKGKESTLPVYKLLSSKKGIHRPRLGLERSIYSEMVGRDQELNSLELQVMKAINREGSIVNIIGEAGIGKSRLVAELKNREVMKQVAFFEGRAISTGRNLSFHPIIDLLKQWARIGEDDSGVVAFNKLDNSIKKVAPEDLDEILPFVATLMGMKLSGRYAEKVKGIEGEALEKLILKSMRDLLRHTTEVTPLVIVIEDLHWADTSSMELLESLFRLAETQCIVFINVFRPAHKETGDRIVDTLKERYSSFYVEINLQPLDERMSGSLIDNMLKIKGLKHTFIDQIVERADGNPFFIEEMVRSLIDHGAVVYRNGGFVVTEKINRMVVPHTISDVLMARIDRLDEKTRDLVKVASVIGRSFFYRILKEVSKTIDDIDNRVSYLTEIQLIRERKRMDELEYLFKHALAQEAAYESILHQTRKDLHIRVANSIESVFKERLHEFYGMLAYHYSKGEDLDKAEEYMIKAGEEALASSASREALHYYQKALGLYLNKYGDAADPEKLALLEKNIALALYNKGEMEEALVYFDRVLERWGVKPFRNKILIFVKLLFDLVGFIFKIYFPSKGSKKVPVQRDKDVFSLSYKKDVALLAIDQIRAVAETIASAKRLLRFDFKNIENWSWTLICISGSSSMSGFYGLSNKVLEYAEGFTDRNNFQELFPLEHFRALHNWFLGKWECIQDTDELLLDENLKTGQFFNVSMQFMIHGWIKIYQGNFNEAYQVIKKLAEIADNYEYKQSLQTQLVVEIYLFLCCRKLNHAKKSLETYESLFKAEVDSFVTMVFLGSKAELQIRLNDLDEADRTLNYTAEIIANQKVLPSLLTRYFLSKLLLDVRRIEESNISNNTTDKKKYIQQASRNRKKLLRNYKKFALDRPDALGLIADYQWLIGKQNTAVKFWKEAMEVSKRQGARPALARTYMEIGKRLLEEKSKYKELNGISAKEYLEKARIMFQEMDLQWDLDELDKIAGTHYVP